MAFPLNSKMYPNSARKEAISRLLRPSDPSSKPSQVLPSSLPEDRENCFPGNDPRPKTLETKSREEEPANVHEIERLKAEIAKELEKCEKATLETADKAGLRDDIGQKEREMVLLRDQVQNLKKENYSLSVEINAVNTKSQAHRTNLNREKVELEACLATLLTVQTKAETRLRELQAMNRNYEDTLDVSIGQVARMYAAVKREEDLCIELMDQLDRKKEKAKKLQEEREEVDRALQEIEGRDWDEEHRRKLEEVDGSCAEIWESLTKTRKQIAEAEANFSTRKALALKQSEEAEALKAKLEQYPAKSPLSGVLSQALFALLLGLVLSLLLPRASHLFQISSF